MAQPSTAKHRQQRFQNMKYYRFNYHSLKLEKSKEMKFEKCKRKRATAVQTQILQNAFAKTAFPSTLQREYLARRLGMSPRTVQIWFQNKRQAARKVYSTFS